MNNKFGILILLAAVLLPISCSPAGSQNAKDLATAQTTLESFFTLLAHGAYAQAAGLYGGEYDTLRSINPAILPDDYAALWENACQVNGFQCLEIKDVLKSSVDAQGFYHFIVEFKQKNGELLVVGPCCGASATEMPPQSQFEFSVRRNKGVFTVQDLPVFIP